MLSRRNFINTTLAAAAALATQGTKTAMAQGKRMIVDAQVHLWKAESDDWKWVPGRKPQLPEPFTIEKLVALMDEAGVDRVVIVPPSWPGDRNDYGLEAAKRYPNRFAVMGRIPLHPDSAKLLPKWREQPGMVGVRLTFMREQAVNLTNGAADWFWPAAEKAGLPVMFLAPDNIPKFAPIAERRAQSDHRPHEPDAGNGVGAANSARHRRRGGAREISERIGQAVVCPDLFAGGLPVA